jgi:hypothetical protein
MNRRALHGVVSLVALAVPWLIFTYPTMDDLESDQ